MKLMAHYKISGVPITENGRLVGILSETDLLRALAEFPRVVKAAAELREPHRVARYLEDTASSFHQFYDSCRGGCMAAKFFTGLPLDGPDPECVQGYGEQALAGHEVSDVLEHLRGGVAGGGDHQAGSEVAHGLRTDLDAPLNEEGELECPRYESPKGDRQKRLDLREIHVLVEHVHELERTDAQQNHDGEFVHFVPPHR